MKKNLQLLSLCGILGGLILFAGDMLFYYRSGSNDLLFNMGHVPGWQIKLSAVTALLATWLYLLGVIPVYRAFKPAPSAVRNVVSLSFAGIVIIYGIVHAAYVAIAVSAKTAVQYGLDMEATTELARNTNNLLRLFAYPLFAVLSVFFIRAVWKRQTLYPRWMIWFFPLIPFLFQGFLSQILTRNTYTIVIGGYFNLMLVTFFTASTIALWNKEGGK